jgi:hypothetical protein
MGHLPCCTFSAPSTNLATPVMWFDETRQMKLPFRALMMRTSKAKKILELTFSMSAVAYPAG